MTTTKHITFLRRHTIAPKTFRAGRTYELPAGMCATLVNLGIAKHAPAPAPSLPTHDEVKAMDWGAQRKLAGSLGLEYSTKAELLTAYDAHLAKEEGP